MSLSSKARFLTLGALCVSLGGCVVEPYPGDPAVVAAGPCCYAYPEYPGYYGHEYYGGPGFVYAHGYAGEHFRGGGYWRH